MDPAFNLELRDIVLILLVLAGLALLLAGLLIFWIVTRIQRIKLPPNADPITALRLTPLSVVVTLDLLDFALDFLSAPIAWTLLNYLGLLPLRAAAAIVSVIPGTQFLPTMTVAWILARLGAPKIRG